ncbi:hypothetical protein C8R45DRAFT_841979 [Mycena sanguinolenta]|nr:hypothetical protein C8R45DRAFT_841979 [Mycena sanguinolenta]
MEDVWESNATDDVHIPLQDEGGSSKPGVHEKPVQAPYYEYYPGAAKTYGREPSFMERFTQFDEHAQQRQLNPYFPFASAGEWEFAAFVERSSLSLAEIDELLKLNLMAGLHLSFKSAQELRSRLEMLPPGPKWMVVDWKTPYPTKKPLAVYYRDPVECVEALLSNPLVQDHIQYTPFRLWETSEKLMRFFSEWLSGDFAWKIQKQLPEGATVLGTVLSTDKTQLTSMTGNRQAHPLLISLADLDMEFRTKASHHAFVLLALLPIAKFLEKNKEIVGVLNNRLFHAIMDFILAPLKKTAEVGQMMRDPLGWRRFCFTPLAGYILDTPESCLETLKLHPWNDLPRYIKEAKKIGLNGVHRPFWRNWPLAEPHIFLNPEMLHHWLKMFWDHLCKWCILAVGAEEIDFRFSVLRPHTGMRHFKEGISKGKQTTGREHRDIMRYIVPVIAGSPGVSKRFLATIASLVDFFYHGQAPKIAECVLEQMSECLAKFHLNKSSIIDAGVRKGKKGPIKNWWIPKLEFLQSVVDAIRDSGAPLQWSADVTERAHIDLVKDPARNSNNQNHENQICRHLDREEKCRNFDLATAMASAGVDFGAGAPFRQDCNHSSDALQEDDPPLLLNSTSKLLAQIDPATRLGGANRTVANFFLQSTLLRDGRFPNAPLPYRTFTSPDNKTAFNLNRDYVGKRISIEEASTRFVLPDLRPALAAYLRKAAGSQIVIGGKRPNLPDDNIFFDQLEYWKSVRIQSRSFHDQEKIMLPETANAAPPDQEWKCGRADAVIVNTDSQFQWPQSGLRGSHTVCQLHMIFRVVPRPSYATPPGTEGFLAYVQRFDIVPQQNPVTKQYGSFPEPASGMYALKRARRADNSPRGDIIPLDRLRCPAELTPQFGKKADAHLKKETSLDHWDNFWLSKWFNKEFFYALSHS